MEKNRLNNVKFRQHFQNHMSIQNILRYNM